LRIHSLRIANFKAITELSLTGLADTVVLAGANGCGKSCVFDAIRLLKSAYGGYQPNEWHQWFNEFQININQANADWLPIFQDRKRPLSVQAEFALSPEEVKYLDDNAERLLTEHTWREVVPDLAGWDYMRALPLAGNLRVHEPEVLKRVAAGLPGLRQSIAMPLHLARVEMPPSGQATTAASRLLELVFGRYDPQHLGIIDYQGANRTYAREQIGNITLNIESSEERRRQHALYNYATKFANLKAAMAGSFIRQLLGKAAGGPVSSSSLTDTLKELFSTFFPGKEFLGPQPTPEGGILFPVRTPNGAVHDIDELSSGEKEVLYGYLRLRNAAPRNSVLLIDEPELHLNPRLVSGLASFYHRHLGRPQGTQLWLVTHSDTMIREAVGQEGFSVFHIQAPGQYEGTNQASSILAAKDLDRVVIELVGDLAAYRPGAKIVVFEGEGESGFDARMTCTLFPTFQATINCISGGSKRRVTQLYELLEQARTAGHIAGKFYAITDSDGESADGDAVPRRFQWNVYHIENYLLDPGFILLVLQEINRAGPPVDTPTGVLAMLRECAAETVNDLIGHKLRVRVRQKLLQCLELGFDPKRPDVGPAIGEALQRTSQRILDVTANDFGGDALVREERRLRAQFNGDLKDLGWLQSFRGRDVLKRFVGRYGDGIPYDVFRDLIIARMRDAEHQPDGMKGTVEAILNDQ
jgi:hypothetical protein